MTNGSSKDGIGPLELLRIGSTASAVTGHFGTSVISDDCHIDKLIKTSSGSNSMSGNSSYTNQGNMNQGSIGISGSYGASGVQKFEAGVTATVGRSHADTSEHLSIGIEALRYGGVQHIDFNDVAVSEFIEGLEGNVQPRMRGVMEAYIGIDQSIGDGATTSDVAAVEAARSDEKYRDWVKKRDKFFLDYGSGIVVGVVWGGLGSVDLDFSKTSQSTMWKASGSGSFSYSGVGASAKIEAAYSHEETDDRAAAKADVSSQYKGNCVQSLIAGWEKELRASATAGLGSLGKTSLSALPDPKLGIPDIPARQKKAATKKLVDKIGEIKDLDGLKTYAKAAAFDKYEQVEKSAGREPMLADFLKEAKLSNDDLDGIPSGAVSPDFSDSDNESDSTAMMDGVIEEEEEALMMMNHAAQFTGGTQTRFERQAILADKTKKDDPKPSGSALGTDFVPLGVWIVSWGQLFPWLATEQNNVVPKENTAIGLITLRTMQQDFLSLRKIYARLHWEGVTVGGMERDFQSIADAFSSQAAAIGEFIGSQFGDKAAGGSKAKIKGFVRQTLKGLGKGPATIYETWCDTPFLRNCELGVGIVVEATNFSPGPVLQSPVSLTKREYTGANSKFGTANFGQIKTEAKSFEPEISNYSVFSNSVKGWPIIHTNGKIMLFVSDGGSENRKTGGVDKKIDTAFDIDVSLTSGILSAADEQPGGCFSYKHPKGVELDENSYGWPAPKHLHAICFVPNKDKDGKASKYLVGQPAEKSKQGGKARFFGNYIYLYPLPFSAAQGVDWKGPSMATGMGDLEGKLEAVRDGLSRLSRMSFDSEYWENKTWSDTVWTMSHFRASYIGLVPEPEGVFQNTVI